MAAKSFLKSLEKGQIVKARVEEVSSGGSTLCSFNGELLLIANHTEQKFKVGDPIKLQVRTLEPLQFHIFDSRLSKFERVV
ncbi:MAG TPA: hypothetical protein VGE46_07800 [Bdellovibrio sp.]